MGYLEKKYRTFWKKKHSKECKCVICGHEYAGYQYVLYIESQQGEKKQLSRSNITLCRGCKELRSNLDNQFKK